MTTEPSVESNEIDEFLSANDFFKKILPFLKERLLSIIIGLLSGSVIAFIASRLFIRSYLSEIGFESLVYTALSNNQTTPTITLGIFSVILIFILNFSLMPMLLRAIYQNFIKTFELQQINENFYAYISLYFTFFLMLPILYLVKFYIGIDIPSEFFVFSQLLNTIPFILFAIEKRHAFSFEKLFNMFSVGVFFSLIAVTMIFPFFLLLDLSHYSLQINWTQNYKSNMFLSQFFYIMLWILFAALTGFRITTGEKFHYFLDLAIALFLLFIALFFSTNALKVSIAEFTGIKDKEARIYKISENDFHTIEKSIKLLWNINNGSNECKKQNDNNKCYLVFSINNLNKDTFIQAKVFFRDENNTILCPPNLYFVGQNIESCFLLKTETLSPTSQTYKSLEKNKNFKSFYSILN